MLQLRRISRSPLAYWLLVAVLAAVTGMVAARVVGHAGALAARYGPLRPVVVTTAGLELGQVVASADVAVAQVPESMVPDGALGSAGDATGRTVVVPALAGVPLLDGNLAPGGRAGVAALLPPGTRAVAVPNAGPGLALVRGDVVDVLATFDPGSVTESDAAPTFPVAEGAQVVDVGDGSATIAVAPPEAAKVAFSMATGVLTLALSAPVSAGSSRPGPEPLPPPPPDR